MTPHLATVILLPAAHNAGYVLYHPDHDPRYVSERDRVDWLMCLFVTIYHAVYTVM